MKRNRLARRPLLLLLSLLMLLGIFSTASAEESTNLLQNPGFEEIGAALRARFYLDEHNCVGVLHHEVDFAVLRAVPPRPQRHALPGQRVLRFLFALNPGIVALHSASTGTK